MIFLDDLLGYRLDFDLKEFESNLLYIKYFNDKWILLILVAKLLYNSLFCMSNRQSFKIRLIFFTAIFGWFFGKRASNLKLTRSVGLAIKNIYIFEISLFLLFFPQIVSLLMNICSLTFFVLPYLEMLSTLLKFCNANFFEELIVQMVEKGDRSIFIRERERERRRLSCSPRERYFFCKSSSHYFRLFTF